MAKKIVMKLTKKSRLLEGKTLKSFGACPAQRRKFTKMFGKSVRVTVARAKAAEAKGLNVDYLSNLMSVAASIAYGEVIDKLWRKGGYSKNETALRRKHKYGTTAWHDSDEMRSAYYKDCDANFNAYSAECLALCVLYWINDPEPRTERYESDTDYGV